MAAKLTKIENELLLFFCVRDNGGLRTDLWEQLGISYKTLTRYVKDLNDCTFFEGPLKRDPECTSEYVILRAWNGDDIYGSPYYGGYSSNVVIFRDDDSAIISHLKRLVLIYDTFEEEFQFNFGRIDDAYYRYDFDEDEDEFPKIPSGTEILRTLSPLLQDKSLTPRTIQRDIRLIGKIIKEYDRLFI